MLDGLMSSSSICASLKRRSERATHTPGTGAGEPAASAGAVALCDERGRRQRAGAGAAVREPRRLSLAVRRGERELSRPCRLPHGASGTARSAVERERRQPVGGRASSISMRWRRTGCGCAHRPGRGRSAAARSCTRSCARRSDWSEQLKEEATDDPQASSRRIAAAQRTAAREREARVAAALDKLAEIEAERERRSKTNKKQVEKQKEPRASTTDPEARVMKMADGGFRPAYNCQISTVAGGQIVVVTDAETVGSDRGLIRPMLDEIKRRYGRWPKRHLVDGGFNKNDDTEWAAGRGIKVYGPAVTQQAQARSLCAARRRRARRRRLARAHEEPARQVGLQASRPGRMHQRPLPQLGPAAVHRARPPEGQDGAALVRPHQQQSASQKRVSKDEGPRLDLAKPGPHGSRRRATRGSSP